MAFKKTLAKSWREIYDNIKPEHCILCGERKTSYCNSHTIPQFVLKNIAKSGMIGTLNAIIELPIKNFEKDEKGVKKSGVIHSICISCDSKYFKDYENPENLKNVITDKMLAEIALKNFLMEIVRTRIDKEGLNNKIKNLEVFTNRPSELLNFQDWDLEDFENEVEEHKNNIVKNHTGAYQIIFHEVLPYKVPLAFPDSISVIEDMDGFIINNTKNLAKENRIQKLHLAILPLEDSTFVLAFYHKKDKKYSNLRHQFNSVLKDKKLAFINYLIFAYSENCFFSIERKEDFTCNSKLSQLTQELFGEPNLGFQILGDSFKKSYKKVQPHEIPNFLSKDWSLED